MTADDAAQAMAAVAMAGASVARAAVEVDRAKWTITALRTERDALAAEVERWVDAHAVLAREVDELRRALSVDDLAAHDEARAEELAPRITAAMLGAYGLGRDDEAAGNPVRTPLNIVENSLPADVPMSANKGHDLRERIAQRIDQAWAVAKDRVKPDGCDEYLDGYLAGLEYAEGLARSTSLTEAGEVCTCRHPVAAHRVGLWGACHFECGCQRITIEAGVRESSDIARHETGEGAEVAPSPMRDETAPSPDPHGACSRALVAVAVERDKARARASRLADEAEAQGRATGFAERERDEARRSLHRVRQMCDDPEIPHAGSCASYRVFKSADGPHPCDCIVADIRRAVDGAA